MKMGRGIFAKKDIQPNTQIMLINDIFYHKQEECVQKDKKVHLYIMFVLLSFLLEIQNFKFIKILPKQHIKEKFNKRFL